MKVAHARSDTEPDTLRLSIDTKAKVKMGLFSRGGRLRCSEPIKALEHDMESPHTKASTPMPNDATDQPIRPGAT